MAALSSKLFCPRAKQPIAFGLRDKRPLTQGRPVKDDRYGGTHGLHAAKRRKWRRNHVVARPRYLTQTGGISPIFVVAHSLDPVYPAQLCTIDAYCVLSSNPVSGPDHILSSVANGDIQSVTTLLHTPTAPLNSWY